MKQSYGAWFGLLGCATAIGVQGCADGEGGGLPLDLKAQNATVDDPVAQGETLILSRDTRQTSKGLITFVKYLDERGDFHFEARDSSGGTLPIDEAEDTVQPGSERVIGDALADAVAAASAEGTSPTLLLSLGLLVPETGEEKVSEVGEVDLETGFISLNGSEVGPEELEAWDLERANRLHARELARDERRAAVLRELLRREGWNWSEDQIAKGAETEALTVDLSASEVNRFVEANRDLIVALDLIPQDEILNLATAMQASGVDDGMGGGGLNMGDPNGSGIGVYQTELNCASTGYIPNYVRMGTVGCSNDLTSHVDACDHAKNVLSIVDAVSPNAFLYCQAGGTVIVEPSTTDLAGTAGNPPVHITTCSAGSNQTAYTAKDRQWDEFSYQRNILSVQAAGNCALVSAPKCTFVGSASPGLAYNLLTVGNYDDNNFGPSFTVVPSSSFTNPSNTRAEKPELSGPGRFINAGSALYTDPMTGVTSSTVITMTGTSQATPHVAGMAADAMSLYSWLKYRPWLAKSMLMKGALAQVLGVTAVNDVDERGVGGIDYYLTNHRGTNSWWEGGNGDITSWDAADPQPGNGTLEWDVSLDASFSKVRVALVWFTRGNYTWAQVGAGATYPIGMDFDLVVLKPNGTFQASSTSFDNAFEYVDFDPTTTGTYRFRIIRSANRDLSLGIYMGMSWTYY